MGERTRQHLVDENVHTCCECIISEDQPSLAPTFESSLAPTDKIEQFSTSDEDLHLYALPVQSSHSGKFTYMY